MYIITNSIHSKQTDQTIYPRTTNNLNHLNNCTSSHSSIHRNTITTIIISNRRDPQSSINPKSNWTPMILKLWIFRLYKTWFWLIHSRTRWSTNRYVPNTRYRQPSCTTNKFTYPNNCNSSRRTTLMNSTETWSKNRCHTRTPKPLHVSGINSPSSGGMG
jgi:hypothetical protein